MKIYVNEESVQCNDDITILILLKQLRQLRPGIALSLNQKILPRERWSTQQIHDGDCILLFHIIAGG